jgi:hypothetical protein
VGAGGCGRPGLRRKPRWFLHPVCAAIPPEDLASFVPPIETRTDTDMIGQRGFQPRDGGWFQCKPWIARALFF